MRLGGCRTTIAIMLGILTLAALASCGSSQSSEQTGGGYINPTPEKENGEPSHEFEPGDVERAEEASQSVREYCEGAASEAQELGCLSHVEPDDVP